MKANEFDNILDECLERILAGGETIEQCLARYPEQAAELEPLLQTVLVSKKAISIEPRPAFREKARRQFQSALHEMAQKRERRFSFFNLQPQWATAIVGVIIVLLASSGTVVAAGNSMPDGALYPVKLATEAVRLKLTPSILGKAELYVSMIDKRVTEIIRMADKGKPEQVEQAAEKMNTYLIAMANLAAPVMAEPATEAPSLFMAPVPEAATEEMPALQPETQKAPAPLVAPPPGQARQARGGQGGQGRGGESDQVRGGEGDQGKGAEIARQAKLRGIMSRNAEEHSAALQAVLERVPESAQPALLRAIAAAETGYQEALRALD